MPRETFTIGVFATIFDEDNRVLFCHRTDYDLWNLPGGCLEKEETPWEGVIREVKEETGLDVEIEKLAGVYSKPEEGDIVFQFICKVIGGKLEINDEADKLEYFTFANLPHNTSPKQVARIKDILDSPDNLTLKTQTGKSSIQLTKEGLL